MSIKIYIAILVLIIISVLVTRITKPWELPSTKAEKLKRSLFNGLFTSFAVFIIFFILGWQNGNEKNSFEKLQGWIGIYFCMGVPAGILSFFGYFIGYKQLSWLTKKKNNLLIRKKQENDGNDSEIDNN